MALSNLFYQVNNDISAVAAEDLSPYTAVTLDGNGQAAYPAAGDKIYGVVLDQYGQGESVRIVTDGIVPCKVTTAGTFAQWDYAAVDANGGLVEGTTTDEQVALIRVAPSADGDIVQVRVSDLINGQFA